MSSSAGPTRPVLIGAVALVCCVLVGFCDMILLGHPISGADAAVQPAYALFEGKAMWQVLVGTAGAVLIPPAGLGCWMLVAGLRSVSGAYRVVTAGALALLFVVGSAVHALYGAIGVAVVTTRAPDGTQPETTVVVAEAIHQQLIVPGVLLGLAGCLVGSLMFSGAVAAGRAVYPRHMAAICPVLVVIAASVGTRLVPAPLGGYLFVAAIHLATPVFFGIPLLWWVGAGANRLPCLNESASHPQ